MGKNIASFDRILNFKIKITFFLVILFSCIFDYESFSQQTENADDNSELIIHRNIRYGEKPWGIDMDSTSDRILDIYAPDFKEGNFPILIFIHGGGFSGGDKGSRSIQVFSEKMAHLGYAVISVNYYLTLKYEKTKGASCTANMSKGLPKSGFHPMLQKAVINASNDVQLVLDWAKNNAKDFGFDTSFVVLAGGSAGAITALYTAYISEQNILPVKAVINLWGGLEHSRYIEKGAPELLTYHGDQDKLIHVDYAYDLRSRMKQIGNNLSETHIIKGKGHAIYNYIFENKIGEINEFLNGLP